MKNKELKQKNKKELENLLNASREKLGKLKFELNNKKLKNTHEIGQTKKEIARIIMLLKEYK